MNTSRSIRSLLLSLFVLLQCVAPLAHAHVNGDHADRHVHIAALDAAWGEHASHAEKARLSHGDHHAAAVCMPPEFRCSALLIDQPADAGNTGMPLLPEHGALVFDAIRPLGFSPPPYQHPFSQAPPVQHS